MTTPQSQPAADSADPTAVILGSRPFNLARQNASRAMGLRFWSLSPRERRRHLRFDAAGRLIWADYPGVWFDVCAVIYLTSIPMHVVHLAAEFPETARKISLRLAESENLNLLSPRFAQWRARFAALIHEATGRTPLQN